MILHPEELEWARAYNEHKSFEALNPRQPVWWVGHRFVTSVMAKG